MPKVERFPMGKGTVTDIYADRQFGFIRQEDGETIFFHAKGVCVPEFENLKEGSEVEFMIVDGAKGNKAIGIVVI